MEAHNIMTRWRNSGRPDVSEPAADELCRCGVILPAGPDGRPEAHGCCTCLDARLVVRAPGTGTAPCPDCVTAPPIDLVRAGVPDAFATARIETWEPASGRERQRVQAWLDTWPPRHTGSFLLLVGGVGTGKTHLAIGALRHAWEAHGCVGWFTTAKRLIDRFRATMGDGATESEERVMAQALVTGLLVLDDIGVERRTGYVDEQLYAVVNGRYEMARPTVATMNAEAYAGLEPRVRSRLSSGVVVEFTGKDRRLA